MGYDDWVSKSRAHRAAWNNRGDRGRLSMRLSASEKPRLIVIEGPAGVGKTTLTQHLSQRLAARGISTLALREFSDSPLGIALEDSSYYGQARPPWVLGVGGT